MLTKKRYSIRNLISWTRWETLIFFGYATIITVLYALCDFTFLNLPWTPIALVGTAVAFVVVSKIALLTNVFGKLEKFGVALSIRPELGE
jgi:hypothetical protein